MTVPPTAQGALEAEAGVVTMLCCGGNDASPPEHTQDCECDCGDKLSAHGGYAGNHSECELCSCCRFQPREPAQATAEATGAARATPAELWDSALQALRDQGEDVPALLNKGADNIERYYAPPGELTAVELAGDIALLRHALKYTTEEYDFTAQPKHFEALDRIESHIRRTPAPLADYEPFSPMDCCGRERDADGCRNPNCECAAPVKSSPTFGELTARITELEQRLARVAELAHDRDGDTREDRSKRLGQCASLAWDHMEETFSEDPLKRKSTLKWAHLAKQLSTSEERSGALTAEVERLRAVIALLLQYKAMGRPIPLDWLESEFGALAGKVPPEDEVAGLLQDLELLRFEAHPSTSGEGGEECYDREVKPALDRIEAHIRKTAANG